MLVVIGGVGLASAAAVVTVVVRARRRRVEDTVRARAEREAQRQAEEARRRAEEQARAAVEQEAQRQAEKTRRDEEEAGVAAERQQAEEARRRAEEQARAAVEQEAQRQAEKTRRDEEEAGVAAERQQAEVRRRAEEQARAAVEQEAQRQAEKTRRDEEEAGVVAERQQAEVRRRAEQEARLAVEQEAERRAEEALRREKREEACAAVERGAQRLADEARCQAEEEARRVERVRLAAEHNEARHGTDLDQPEGAEAAELCIPVERQTRAPGHAPAPTASSVAPLPFGEAPARRRVPQYRPPSGAPSVPRQPPGAATKDGPEPDAKEEAARTARALPIEVRVLFDRGGCCRVTLLPKRRAGLPDECAVSSAHGGSLELVALEEEWYQDVAPEDLATLLRAGTVWAHQATGQEWTLAGREIFVLAAGTTHRGFVSCPRLTLGREHIVLCATTKLAQVEQALQKAGCTNQTVFREEDGTPSGWVLVGDMDKSGRARGLFPTCAVLMMEGSDILNVLRPLPEIEISLEGGVPLGYSSWLAGFPPLIRVLGDAQHIQKVLIDGKEATIAENAAFRAPGWDEPGTHQVWCSNVSRSYSLVRLERSWQAWPAYVFPSAGGGGDCVAICGPLVRPLGTGDVLDVARNFERGSILQSNPILLGAVPGQVFIATPRRDVRGARCFASPPFEAVWALPAQPLHCDKATCRIFLVARSDASVAPDGSVTGRSVSQWCRLILDASRKGLSSEPAAARELWVQYKRFARNLWRKTR